MALRVLIIDDNPIERLLLKAILQKAGVTYIQEAENGQVGCAKSKVAAQTKQPYDVVFIDLQMPLLDGVATIRNLRREPNSEKVTLIMLTGAADRTNVAAAIEAGVNDFIVKPMNEDVVLAKLAHFVSLPKEPPTS